MAIGDDAAAAGYEVFEDTQDRRMGYQNDNQRGDDLARHVKVHRRLFGVNSVHYPSVQVGAERKIGNNLAGLSIDVLFPVAFKEGESPNVQANLIGYSPSAASATVLGLAQDRQSSATISNISLTGFTVDLQRSSSTYLSGFYWYIDWSARGVLAV